MLRRMCQLSVRCSGDLKAPYALANAQDAAAAFCAKHGLPEEVSGSLAAHIGDNLARAMLPTPGGTPSESEAGGDVDDATAHASASGEQPAADLRDSFFSEEDSFVAEPLPAAAARPAEGRTYTAPSSPTRRPSGRGLGGNDCRRPPQFAAAADDQDIERAVAETEAVEGEHAARLL